MCIRDRLSIGKITTLGKAALNSLDELAEFAVRGIDNLLPRDLADIPIPVEGALREGLKKVLHYLLDKNPDLDIIDTLLT